MPDKEVKMDKVKGGTNCQLCIDCQRMTDGHTTSWRCYGTNVVEIKRDICEGEFPPKTAPDFCPNRLKMPEEVMPDNKVKPVNPMAEKLKEKILNIIASGRLDACPDCGADLQNVPPHSPDEVADQIISLFKPSTSVKPDKEVMPLITKAERLRLIRKADYHFHTQADLCERCASFLIETQCDADQKWSDDRLEAREKEWAEKEADCLETFLPYVLLYPMTEQTKDSFIAHLAGLRQTSEGKGTIGEVYKKLGKV